MPLPSENVELVLEGLEQKTSAKLTTPGRLDRAENVAFDKSGQLDKREGFSMLEDTQADSTGLPAHNARLMVTGDELLLFSPCFAFAMHDPGETLQGSTRSMVRRGIVGSGAVSGFAVTVGTDSEEVP